MNLDKAINNESETTQNFTHLGLFEGIGGFSLAAEWMGWETLAWCEWNEFGQKILRYFFPKAEGFSDITKTDFTKYANRIDILTGGFPCQPYSLAGKRKGKADERHLWPEMLRAIREIQPTYVVGENVLGLLNWNGGLVFDEVQADLETEGYEVWPYVLPACAKDAPHRRDRVWFVAYSHNHRESRRARENESESKKERLCERDTIQQLTESDSVRELFADTQGAGGRGLSIREEPARPVNGSVGSDGNAADTRLLGQTLDEKQTARIEQRDKIDAPNSSIQGLQGSANNGSIGESRPDGNKQLAGRIPSAWQNFPTQSPIRCGNDGIPAELDGITLPKWRNESIKAFGNAIVPQVALEIFKAIQATHQQTQTN